MNKVVFSKDSKFEAGAFIDDEGNINQYNTLDVDAFKKHVRDIRETYVKGKDVWHIGSLDRSMIDCIRIEKKYPNNNEGWNLAIAEAKKRLINGEYKDFLIHDY